MSTSARSARRSKTAAGRKVDDGDLRSELQRLEAELAELRASARLYRAAAEIGKWLVWCADREGRLTHVAPIFSELTGISEERFVEGGWIDAIHPEDREAFSRAGLTACGPGKSSRPSSAACGPTAPYA